MGENIGAAARVMRNFGLSQLRVVNPRDGWPNHKAIDMAKWAADIVEQAVIYDTLDEALDGVHKAYALTARRRDMVKPSFNPRQLVADMQQKLTADQQAAFIFGSERSGLSNEQVSLCDGIVTIPVDEGYTSLNLAQAVAVMCYEYAVCDAKEEEEPAAELADKSDVLAMVRHFEQVLDDIDYFRVPEKRDKMLQNIRNMFIRAEMTEQEVRTMRGILKALN